MTLLPRLTLLGLLLLAGALAFLQPQPASACIDLQGDAAWFYRSCQAGEPGPAASWTVKLDPAVPGQKSLSMQVENAYPGYQLECDLYFANNGELPFFVKTIEVLNPNPSHLALAAALAPGDRGKTLQPCGFAPAWGQDPAQVPPDCQAKIHLSLAVGPEVAENQSLPFTIQVYLREKLAGGGQH